MRDGSLDLIPDEWRPAAVRALGDVLGERAVDRCAPVYGGASGALTYRVDAAGAAYLLRIETGRDFFRNPSRSYPCLLTAAGAGIAPATHYADADAGVAIMDFIQSQPVESHVGGTDGLIVALGTMLGALQRTEPFPQMVADFGDLVDRMLAFVDGAGVFTSGALRPYGTRLADLRAAYPWTSEPQVSSHNDVNLLNVLYDGDRLWLIDWELAFANDAYADLAIVANNLADTEERVDALLAAWASGPPTEVQRARLQVMRCLSQLYYATLILSGFAGRGAGEPRGVTPDELRTAIEAGELAPASPQLLFELGRTNLRAFHDATATRDYQSALRLVAASGTG